jgi:predicted RNA-binding Zn-ribbon protein involved in translation (DUF1610 family)
VNPATLASIRATAEHHTEYACPEGGELGLPPKREEGMPYHKWESACRRWARSACRYVCPSCEKTHTSEEDAEQCCPRDIDRIWVDDATGKEYSSAGELAMAITAGKAGRVSGPASVPSHVCPVCGKASTSPHEAVECCLWKDLAAPARWALATALENGSTWTEELAKVQEGAA